MPRNNVKGILFPDEGGTKESLWYALAITFTLLSSIIGYNIVNDELVKPEIYDGSVYSLGRQGFTADAYQYISENSEHPVIAIGTSKMREAFNGMDFETRSQFEGIDYYNMGIGGNYDYWRMIETQRIIEANPEVVIMEIGPSTFSSLPYPIDQGSIDRMNAFLYQQPFFEERDWIEILDEEDAELLPLEILDRINYTSTISFVAIEEHLKELHEGPRGYECDSGPINRRCVPSQDSVNYEQYLRYPPQYKDYIGRLKREDPNGLKVFYETQMDKSINGSYHNPENIYNRNHEAFDFMIEEFLDSKIDVILTTIPYNPIYRKALAIGQWDYYNDSVLNYKENSDIHVVDIMWNEYDIDDYFIDFGHMNESGELLFTDLMIPTVDKVISDRLSKYGYDEEFVYELRRIEEYKPSDINLAKNCNGTEVQFQLDTSLLINAQEYTSCTLGINDLDSHAWENVTDEDGKSYIQSLPNLNLFDRTASIAPSVTYSIEVQTKLDYMFWFEVRADSGADDSFHIRLNGELVTSKGGIGCPYPCSSAQWVWNNETPEGEISLLELNEGTNIVTLWMKEDGYQLSRIYITSNLELSRDDVGALVN